MHDPNTVAFEIRAPWFRRNKHFRSGRYHPSLVTIWHVDPEADGSDDSCGWSRPRLTKEQRGRLQHLARGEARRPWYLWAHAMQHPSAMEAEALCRQAILVVARMLEVKVSLVEAERWAAELMCDPVDNLRSSFCFVPGWHSNFKEDRESDREMHAADLFFILGRYILRQRRRWWQHPRWHLNHWRIQVHLVQDLKRWLFTRCSKCGKRFPFGAAVCAGSWHGTGPRWFRSETEVFHAACATRHPSQ